VDRSPRMRDECSSRLTGLSVSGSVEPMQTILVVLVDVHAEVR